MSNLNEFKKAQALKDILIEEYINLNMEHKKELKNNYSVDCGYDYAKWIISHFDVAFNLDINVLV